MTVDHAAVRAPEAGELKYLVYTSVATRTMLPEDLESILFTSRRKNLDAEITGILLYRGSSFVQFLEGPLCEVDSLMDRIARDDRHTGVRVLVVERVTERSFGDWKMGFALPKNTRPTGVDGLRDSFTDLTSGGDYDMVRQAAEDFSIWFKAGQRARPS
ncbi:BLUF domain-containing protein [Dietzia kunjamensis]|uniref:BLUF domain-containing protein n=1 Tax=Dietzia kunjamensis TaxID=322509 RepID=UPI002DBAA374|nr:BLUF domain-containing protein [Dietzia kunjamensis]MEB8327650.1 BLUF domain-containing protein [Dietzia kunjamensis]